MVPKVLRFRIDKKSKNATDQIVVHNSVSKSVNKWPHLLLQALTDVEEAMIGQRISPVA